MSSKNQQRSHLLISEPKEELIPETASTDERDLLRNALTTHKPRTWSLFAAKFLSLFSVLLALTIILCQIHGPLGIWKHVYPHTWKSDREGISKFRKINPLAGCKPEEVTIRREWSTLSLEDRKAFTAAVNCLFDSPSKLDPTIFPAAQNRYDDFVALHINLTLTIHFSGLFLPWHRHLLWLWNKALQNECGYKGDIPYWQWEKYAHNFHDNAIFDGSEGSMSGDGIFDGLNRTGPDVFPRGPLPRGDGGGCIKSGPFKGRMVNFGPYDWQIIRNDAPVLPADWAAWRPRCLDRDLTPAIARDNHNESVIRDLLYKPQTLGDWIDALQGPPHAQWLESNPHGAGHFALGGPGADFFASPGEPTFWIHHSNVDRVWSQWVNLDPEHRQYALHGTHTIFNKPPSPEVTVDDTVDMGIEDDGTMVIKRILEREPYCYIYDDE